MKNRFRIDDYYYFVVLNKAKNSVSIFTTMAVMSASLGVNRTTLYRRMIGKAVYDCAEYTIWRDVEMYKCNKGRNI